MGGQTTLVPDQQTRHEAICDACRETIFGIRHQCLICPDWNYCNDCIAQAPRKHARHEFAVIPDPEKPRDNAMNRSQALDFGRLETRFLTINSSPPCFNLPTEGSIRVSCELSIKSLYECPEYVALSYSWGNHGSTRPILLDGHITHVTISLEMALQELITRGVRVVWVDAVCIDQSNKYEKVYQLRQMGTIFSKATKVVAWLGPVAEDSDDAMQALESMRKTDDVDQHGLAIAQLLNRGYWERVRIIQELAKAATVEVWCGTQMVTWGVFIEGVETWWTTSKLRFNDFDHPILALKYFCDAERNSRRGAARMLLSTAMIRTLHTKATLKRDRIYALLGITRDGAETVPTPNYVQRDAQVFDAILKHMIVEQGQLSLMFLAGLGRIKGSSPSWLPVWNEEMPLQASSWITRCFESPLGESSAVRCQDNVLRVNAQILGQLYTKSETELAWEIELQMLYLLRAALETRSGFNLDLIGSGLCSSLGTQPGLLSDLWCSLTDVHQARYSELQQWFELLESGRQQSKERATKRQWSKERANRRQRSRGRADMRQWSKERADRRQWFEKHADMLYDNVTLRLFVEAVNKYRRMEVYDDDPESNWLKQLWSQLERDKILSAGLSRHGLKMQALDQRSRRSLVIVPICTETSDCVARVAHCSLPVVLRENSDGMYSVVGEVFEVPGWDASDPAKADERLRSLAVEIQSLYTRAARGRQSADMQTVASLQKSVDDIMDAPLLELFLTSCQT